MLVDKRSGQRNRCRIDAAVKSRGGKVSGSIDDLSVKGARIETLRPLDIRRGDIVNVLSNELGWLQGRVCWHDVEAFGMELDSSTNSKAKTKSRLR